MSVLLLLIYSLFTIIYDIGKESNHILDKEHVLLLVKCKILSAAAVFSLVNLKLVLYGTVTIAFQFMFVP
jgi:hypothetical protein